MTDITIGAWAEVPLGHPLAPGLTQRGKLPNPAYEKAMMLGVEPVTRTKTKDGVVTKTPIPKHVLLYEEVGNYLRVPRMMVPWKGATLALSEGQPFDFQDRITLREYQHPFVDKLTETVRLMGGATGQASAGFGKTMGVLKTIARLGRTALILVNKEFLMEQWVERILGTEQMMERLKVKTKPSEMYPPAFGIRPDQVGLVRGPKCEYEGRGIVIAMAQSLVARQYSPEFYDYFGTVAVDEVHNFAAPTFQSTVVMFPSRYRIGVTATPERKDGLEQAFFSHIGEVCVVGTVPRINPRINRVLTPVVWTEGVEYSITRRMGDNRRPDFNRLLDFLCTHEARNRFMVQMMVKAAAKGRKLLILSQRREHLDLLKALFEEECQRHELGISTDFIRGGMKKDERKLAERMQALFGTYSMAKEALDIPSLDTLFLTTPVADVEQPVGRIQRLYEGKLDPVVVDFRDEALRTCKNLGEKRDAEYRRLGWLKKAAA